MADTAVPMREPMRADVLARLQGEMDFVRRGDYLQRGTCPSCGKREMFTNPEGPWVLKCGRLNNCGAAYHIKELYPDLFDTWTNRYGPRAVEQAKKDGRPIEPPGGPQSATPVADAYLEIGRGFDLDKIRGWYTQDHYYDDRIDAGTTTVRFPLPNGHWERLLDKPERFGKQKARAIGPYKGLWWQPPGVDLAAEAEIWIVEGIFDAIALRHAGITAVSSISCSNLPEESLATLTSECVKRIADQPRLVFAYDGDKAGARYIRAHVNKARAMGWKCSAAVIPARRGKKRLDWNDALQRGELTEEHQEGYRYHGKLLIAQSARHKASLIYERSERRAFWFEFRRRLYWFEINAARLEKALKEMGYDNPEDRPTKEDREKAMRQAAGIQQIANCHPQALYYLRNGVTDEAWYYWSVHQPDDAAPVRNTFTGSQLASASEFKKRLMHVSPGALWKGTSAQLDTLLSDQVGGIRTIESLDYIGYSRTHNAWVWGDIAVRNGKVHKLNDEDYFDFGRLHLKTLAQSPALSINADRAGYITSWATHIWQAFGARGIICLAFWLGSLFAEQIREKQKSYPFLEVVGEAAAGKTTLIEFLWKLCGRVGYEGFDPAKATHAGRARNFSQVSNLPVVLIESDRDPDTSPVRQKSWDWDELKTAYNGRSVRARGLRTMGNDTYEPPFRSAVVISQNAPVNASEAIMQRIVQTVFTRDTHTEATRRLAGVLECTPMEQVSGFALQATCLAEKLLAAFDRHTASHEAHLRSLEAIRVHRIALNHAQIAGLIACLGKEGLGLLPDNAILDAHNELYGLAIERQRTINSDHPIVQEFWETFDYLEGLDKPAAWLNHYGQDEDRQIAVSLKHFEAVVSQEKLRAPTTNELKRHLKASKTRPFIESNRAVSSRIFDRRTTRCWVFDRKGGRH